MHLGVEGLRPRLLFAVTRDVQRNSGLPVKSGCSEGLLFAVTRDVQRNPPLPPDHASGVLLFAVTRDVQRNWSGVSPSCGRRRCYSLSRETCSGTLRRAGTTTAPRHVAIRCHARRAAEPIKIIFVVLLVGLSVAIRCHARRAAEPDGRQHVHLPPLSCYSLSRDVQRNSSGNRTRTDHRCYSLSRGACSGTPGRADRVRRMFDSCYSSCHARRAAEPYPWPQAGDQPGRVSVPHPARWRARDGVRVAAGSGIRAGHGAAHPRARVHDRCPRRWDARVRGRVTSAGWS